MSGKGSKTATRSGGSAGKGRKDPTAVQGEKGSRLDRSAARRAGRGGTPPPDEKMMTKLADLVRVGQRLYSRGEKGFT